MSASRVDGNRLEPGDSDALRWHRDLFANEARWLPCRAHHLRDAALTDVNRGGVDRRRDQACRVGMKRPDGRACRGVECVRGIHFGQVKPPCIDWRERRRRIRGDVARETTVGVPDPDGAVPLRQAYPTPARSDMRRMSAALDRDIKPWRNSIAFVLLIARDRRNQIPPGDVHTLPRRADVRGEGTEATRAEYAAFGASRRVHPT